MIIAQRPSVLPLLLGRISLFYPVEVVVSLSLTSFGIELEIMPKTAANPTVRPAIFFQNLVEAIG